MSAPSVHRHPAWFGAVMGTAATSVVILAQAETWDLGWLVWGAVAFLLIATLLAIILWPRYVRRLADRDALATELADPGHGAMLATVPAGLLVLAVAWGRVGPEIIPSVAAVWIDIVLLVVGASIAVALGVAWAGAIASGTNDLASVNGGWLIPPVMNLLVPLALVPVIAYYPQQASWLVPVALGFLGIGTVLFLALMAVLVGRLALRPRQLPQLAPSLWIPLAPAGILGFALLRVLQAATAAEVPGFTSATAGVVVASMGIGFGLWWAAFAGMEVQRLRRAGGIPFHPGWWGFVFPIAAMTLAIGAVGSALDSLAVQAMGAVAAVILLAVWGMVAVRTVSLVRRAAGQ
jgi:C4-dicarboxylate transporter/malic acid transport protein